jgi:UDP-N-acetylglucosamine--N-acetylmuramyl-(pentapeptide) pyrophosphoryl-undecaprenol N-acetylglucosamine transferase
MKILFSGGGTLGPVTPLLALHENIKDLPGLSCVWVGTESGPEEILIKNAGIPFLSLPASKLRRYFSWKTLSDVFVFAQALFQSFVLLRRERPSVCISAGGYVSVPLHIVAKILGIKTWIHQQDLELGLANRLMAPTANLITVAVPQSLLFFPKEKTRMLGNPVRPSILEAEKKKAFEKFGLDANLPVIFATGGGTGSEKINVLVAQLALELGDSVQIIHLTGKERKTLEPDRPLLHYHTFEFLGEHMADAYAASDIVICRGGFGTLSELAALKKTAIVIPKSGHQEENVKFCADLGGLLSLNENTTTSIELQSKVEGLLADPQLRLHLGETLATCIPTATKESIFDCFKSLGVI